MNHIKQYGILVAIGLFAALLGTAVAVADTGVALTNSGFVELGSDPSSFGLAICGSTFTGTVPVSVTANGVTETLSLTPPPPSLSCGYLYAPYATFNMIPGSTYSISVTIDPEHTLITNTDNQATYASVTVPGASGGQVLGASVISGTERQLLLNELLTAENELKALLLKISA